jgi:menaquinol-cytochrome c reductase iron-sulfur subunit
VFLSQGLQWDDRTIRPAAIGRGKGAMVDFKAESLTGKTAGASPNGHEGLEITSSGRRSFLGLLLGAGAATVGALLSAPLVRFALHPVFKAAIPLLWTEVGELKDFASAKAPVQRFVKIEQRDGWRKVVTQKVLYVCKDAHGKLSAFSSICPHLGCSVAWHDEKNNFICPCHNGQFTADGKLLGGPPPRGLDLLDCKVEDGKLMVHYQYFRQLVPNKEVIT